MPKRAIVAATILAIATTDASAQREQGYLAGLGTTSCADFGDSYRRDPKATDLYYFAWAEGYMSALNTSRGVIQARQNKGLECLDPVRSTSSSEIVLRAEAALTFCFRGARPLWRITRLPRPEYNT
jgi:hypothetical protein